MLLKDFCIKYKLVSFDCYSLFEMFINDLSSLNLDLVVSGGIDFCSIFIDWIKGKKDIPCLGNSCLEDKLERLRLNYSDYKEFVKFLSESISDFKSCFSDSDLYWSISLGDNNNENISLDNIESILSR